MSSQGKKGRRHSFEGSESLSFVRLEHVVALWPTCRSAALVAAANGRPAPMDMPKTPVRRGGQTALVLAHVNVPYTTLPTKLIFKPISEQSHLPFPSLP